MKDDRPTSFDIAYRAGVSQSTVSRALRDSPLVNEETRQRIQAIAQELNYKIDRHASSLRSKHTSTIALLLCEESGAGDSLINPFFLAMLGSITRACADRGYDLLVSFQQMSADWHADFEGNNRADGIIFLGYGDYVTYVEKLIRLNETGAHYITWGPVLPGQPGMSIGCDNYSGAYQVTRHLIDLGHKRIAFVGDKSEHAPEFSRRYEGYSQALKDANLPVEPELQVEASSSETDGSLGVQVLKQRGMTFDALFGASDLIAIGAIQALEAEGLVVPEDVAVVGFDDIPTAAYTHPPLTTVQQNTRLAGQLLVDNLLLMIDGEQPESFLLPTELIVRGSCGAKTPSKTGGKKNR